MIRVTEKLRARMANHLDARMTIGWDLGARLAARSATIAPPVPPILRPDFFTVSDTGCTLTSRHGRRADCSARELFDAGNSSPEGLARLFAVGKGGAKSGNGRATIAILVSAAPVRDRDSRSEGRR